MSRTGNGVVRSVNVTAPGGRRIRQIARDRGMLIYRAFDLVLEGWDMLTEEQQHEAMKRICANRREPLPACAAGR